MNLFRNVPKTVWLIAFGHLVADLSPGALYVALPFLKAKFALSYAEVSAIVLMQNVASSISQPIFGYLSDQKHRPWLMPAGCMITGIFMALSLLVPSYYLVMVCTAISGLGNSAFHPEAAKTVNFIGGREKGKAVSIFSFGGYVGVALGSMLLAALLLEGQSLRILLYTLPSLIIGVALFNETNRMPSPEIKGKGSLVTLKECVNWSLLALLGMILTRATVTSGIATFVPLYYVSYLGGDSIYASSLLTVYLAAGAIGTMAGGILSDKYGSKTVMLYSILPIAVMMYLFLSASGPWIFVLLALAGILLSATATSSLVLTQKMMPKNVGMASGFTLGFSVGLGTMGVLGLGQVADYWGITFVFDILVLLPIIGFILTLFIKEPGHLGANAVNRDVGTDST
ncbi:Fosmidomycin resistance protein [Sporomusa rhizae]|uniref:MFS transporter n=1 Tax=Sporomusa rhizae TaxID=357999 RepID=UPI00352A7130